MSGLESLEKNELNLYITVKLLHGTGIIRQNLNSVKLNVEGIALLKYL